MRYYNRHIIAVRDIRRIIAYEHNRAVEICFRAVEYIC